jgi:hypothetical protein
MQRQEFILPVEENSQPLFTMACNDGECGVIFGGFGCSDNTESNGEDDVDEKNDDDKNDVDILVIVHCADGGGGGGGTVEYLK